MYSVKLVHSIDIVLFEVAGNSGNVLLFYVLCLINEGNNLFWVNFNRIFFYQLLGPVLLVVKDWNYIVFLLYGKIEFL